MIWLPPLKHGRLGGVTVGEWTVTLWWRGWAWWPPIVRHRLYTCWFIGPVMAMRWPVRRVEE